MRTLLPEFNAYNERFWAGLREKRITMPRCTACGHIQYPMGPCCSECLEGDFEWIELSGRGHVGAYIVYHHAFHPSLADQLPYNVAEVKLEENVTVLTNIVGIGIGEIENGIAVEARFEAVDDNLTLLRFAPLPDR